MCEHENYKMIRQCNWSLSEYECDDLVNAFFYVTSSTAGASVAGIFALGSSWLG